MHMDGWMVLGSGNKTIIYSVARYQLDGLFVIAIMNMGYNKRGKRRPSQ